MATNIASNMGFISDRGGVTPHMRTRRVLARDASSSLSLTGIFDECEEEGFGKLGPPSVKRKSSG